MLKLFKLFRISHFQNLYLSHRPRRGANQIHHPQWNQQSGGKCEESPNGVTPPGVLVHIVELQRGVFNQREDKCSLNTQERRKATGTCQFSWHAVSH